MFMGAMEAPRVSANAGRVKRTWPDFAVMPASDAL
jgi:hypothetical protein